jgi:hypothetical protein
MSTIRGGLLGWAGLIVLAPAAGCGANTTRVSGRVLLDGQPLPGGVVTFVSVEGKAPPAIATIREDGTFEMPNAPLRSVQVTVNNLPLKPAGSKDAAAKPRGRNPHRQQMPPAAVERAKRERLNAPSAEEPEKMPGTYVALPPKYLRVETSGLTLDVKRGADSYTIELSGKDSPPIP